MNKKDLVKIKKNGAIGTILEVEHCEIIGLQYKVFFNNEYWWMLAEELEVIDVQSK